MGTTFSRLNVVTASNPGVLRLGPFHPHSRAPGKERWNTRALQTLREVRGCSRGGALLFSFRSLIRVFEIEHGRKAGVLAGQVALGFHHFADIAVGRGRLVAQGDKVPRVIMDVSQLALHVGTGDSGPGLGPTKEAPGAMRAGLQRILTSK